ncbi:cell envelope integrity protein CreD [Ekhidna sp.]|uniref:cell envelope integrity protein CreD n=1 Tax=Ekhidna sp. TaxID=2608089 RepID=UPI003B50C287
MENENASLDRLNRWIKNSVTLKLGTIGILILILLIPSSMIKSIIDERESLSLSAISEVSSKWADEQTMTGPVLNVPLIYEYQNEVKDEKSNKLEIVTYEKTEILTILPNQLKVNGSVSPKSLKRGIYEVVVYESELKVNGSFALDLEVDKTNLKEVRWNNAFITLGISDLRGIKEGVIFECDEKRYSVKPGSKSDLIKSGVSFQPKIIDSLEKLNFEFILSLQGSQNLSFIPLGGVTDVNLASKWTTPSFNGNFLPDKRSINENGFQATWKVLQLNRNYPQQWLGFQNPEQIKNSQFGVNLLLPLDDYQKSMRSAKYSVMTLALTFLVFFIVEILNKKKIHPLQYTLVGLGLCLFYILLVSISEHSNFNFSYLISSVSIITMITLYSLSILRNKKMSMILSVILVCIYGFVFITLQLADYALLLGSIGLTIILGLTMYFTRKIDWYNIQEIGK